MENKFGLKAGLEIHQQLDTNKLFCNCPSILRNDEPKLTRIRKLNPVVGETGEVDAAAAYEKLKDKKFVYEVYDTNCLVELDEEPPHEINQEALKIALQISLLLNCEIFPVTQVMRKTVIDGSNTSGFQRTALIAHDGFIETSLGKVGIETVAIEEDSARIISNEKDKSVYRLDRLGIPLVEITTKPDLKTPEQIKEAALKIGEILRACKVKRGIGTIRQDLNVSSSGAERVEIKGFQEPKTMIQTVNLEVERQQKLVFIHEEINKRKAKGASLEKIKDVTELFKNTECKFVKAAIEKKAKAFAVNVSGFAKLLGESLYDGKRFGTEISDYAKSQGVNGLIHSDENLAKYNFSEKEISELKNVLEIKKDDAFIMIVDEEVKARKAIELAIFRANEEIKNATLKEVRKANEDGSTSFLRPMPGSARMYPETDLKLLKISRDMINDAKNNLPKLLSENKKFLEKFGLNENLVKDILDEDKLEDFKFLSKTTKNYSLIAKTLVSYPREISAKENKSIEAVFNKLHLDLMESVLEAVEKGKISESDVKLILQKVFEGEKLENALKKEKVDLESEIKSLIKEKPNLSENAYMGLIMAKFKGKVNGQEVMKEIKRVLK